MCLNKKIVYVNPRPGLHVAPLMMKKVVMAVLSQDSEVERATIPYVDDLCINEDSVSAER